MLLQMDGRLRDLPLTSAAFARGQITISQLRLLLRVTTPESETAWIEKAARLNVRLLEREVTADSAAQTTRPLPDDEEEQGRPVSFDCPDRLRAQW